jgi:septum formation protein
VVFSGLPQKPIVLASRSPRRRALLEAAGAPFVVRVSGVEEEAHQFGAPAEQALRTARAKAEAIAAGAFPECGDGAAILAADTIVVLGDAIFNKPVDGADALRMLQRLSGQWHTVITAVCLGQGSGGAWIEEAVPARVRFRPFDGELVARYIASGEPADKAGAYGIQGLGARLVAEVDGDLTGVIGLPLLRTDALHRELTGRPLLRRGSLREIALRAFPDLASLPEACLNGMQ